MLEIKNLKKTINKKSILSDVSLNISSGQVFGILGKNGAGKTTLFNTIYYNNSNENNSTLNNKSLSRSDISFLETENYFYPYMKAYEYFSFFEDKKDVNDRLNKIIKLFDIPLNNYIHTFSTGMKKKTAIIGSIKLDKKIIILDEPFNGLDMESVEILYLIINELKKKGKIILISSHIIETLTNCCDKIGYLGNGIIEKIYSANEFNQIHKNLKQLITDKWHTINE